MNPMERAWAAAAKAKAHEPETPTKKKVRSSTNQVNERDIQHGIRLALGGLDGVVLFRNNTGVADYNGQRVRYGLAPGSSDLIGMVDGRFVAIEVKSPTGRTTSEQDRFLKLVRLGGGFACVVRSVDEATAAVRRCREGMSE